MATARSESVTSGMTSVNSSPPSRATVARPETVRSKRSAISHRRRSPMAWPSVSFTSLNRSMSISAMTTPRLSLSAVAARVKKSVRLGRPVSMSWVAWCDLESTS